jgi:hypothetical protein
MQETFDIYKFQNFEHGNESTIVPSDLFHDEIRLIFISFTHSESEFVWEVLLGLKISKF